MNGGKVWKPFQAVWTAETHLLDSDTTFGTAILNSGNAISVCGEIDQEITVPELVKEDTLCPHQDFVYMCSPTAEEAERLKRFEETSGTIFTTL